MNDLIDILDNGVMVTITPKGNREAFVKLEKDDCICALPIMVFDQDPAEALRAGLNRVWTGLKGALEG